MVNKFTDFIYFFIEFTSKISPLRFVTGDHQQRWGALRPTVNTCLLLWHRHLMLLLRRNSWFHTHHQFFLNAWKWIFLPAFLPAWIFLLASDLFVFLWFIIISPFGFTTTNCKVLLSEYEVVWRRILLEKTCQSILQYYKGFSLNYHYMR